jgi:hypothetical protein
LDEDLKKEIKELLKELSIQDSIDIGNSKTGILKVYCNFNNPTEAEEKLKVAIKILRNNRKAVLDEV